MGEVTSPFASDHIPPLNVITTKALWEGEWDRIRTERLREVAYQSADKRACVLFWIDSPLTFIVCTALFLVGLWTTASVASSDQRPMWPWVSLLCVVTLWIGTAYATRLWMHAVPCCVSACSNVTFAPLDGFRDTSVLGRCCVTPLSNNSVCTIWIHAGMAVGVLITCWLVVLERGTPLSYYRMFIPLWIVVAFGVCVMPFLSISRVEGRSLLNPDVAPYEKFNRQQSSVLLLDSHYDSMFENLEILDLNVSNAIPRVLPHRDVTPLTLRYIVRTLFQRLAIASLLVPFLVLLMVRLERGDDSPRLVWSFALVWALELATVCLIMRFEYKETPRAASLSVLLLLLALVAAQILFILHADFHVVEWSGVAIACSIAAFFFVVFIAAVGSYQFFQSETMHPRILLRSPEPTWTVAQVMNHEPIWV